MRRRRCPSAFGSIALGYRHGAFHASNGPRHQSVANCYRNLSKIKVGMKPRIFSGKPASKAFPMDDKLNGWKRRVRMRQCHSFSHPSLMTLRVAGAGVL